MDLKNWFDDNDFKKLNEKNLNEFIKEQNNTELCKIKYKIIHQFLKYTWIGNKVWRQ